jgi:ZIP family zinc transporter
MIILFITLATIVSTTFGGLFAIKYKDKLHLILGFSAGAVLGVALFDLIPESIALTKGTYDIGLIMLLTGIGFAAYMLIDRHFSLHGHCEELCEECDHKCENPAHNTGFGVSALIVHSFLDGFAIGMAFKVSPFIGWVVAVAILAHKFSDGINTVGILFRDNKDRKETIPWLSATSLAPALGIASTYLFTVSESTLGLIFAVFVGLFLYLSASDLIPESHHHHSTVWTSIMTVAGMATIYLAILFAL